MSDEKLLVVTSSPHLKGKRTTRNIMLDVIIAMLPALGFAVYHFGIRALVLTAITVLTCVVSEEFYCRAVKRKSTVYDLSAVVTGILLAFNLPVTMPMWMAVLGSVFAIVIVKMLFGGIGQNIVNPALAARVFLFLSFPSYMTPMQTEISSKVAGLVNTDVVASATPLAQENLSLLDLFIGNINGVIGEVSTLCLLIGGIYLLVRKIIAWQIPVGYLATVALISLVATPDGVSVGVNLVMQLCGGGLMLGAIYMATDYATSPVTPWGRLIFGIGCGALTMVFRLFSANTEGVSFGILIMNLLVYYIDRFTQPRRFGAVKAKKAKA